MGKETGWGEKKGFSLLQGQGLLLRKLKITQQWTPRSSPPRPWALADKSLPAGEVRPQGDMEKTVLEARSGHVTLAEGRESPKSYLSSYHSPHYTPSSK